MIETTLVFSKETKNTYRYDAESADDVSIPSLYIRKDAFEGEAPESIIVIVKPSE